VSWISPDPWHCYACGADGLGGRPAADAHQRDKHTPPPPPVVARGVVPDGIQAAAVRAWAKANGWPNLGRQGRLPQAAIDAYLHRPPDPRPRRVDLADVDELRALGNTTAQIADRPIVTVAAIEKAESRRRRA
jgi:hypothetical protein